MATTDPSCFEAENLEDLAVCPNDELQSGLSEVNIYYILEDHIDKMVVPPPAGTYEEAGTITDDIVPKTGKGFARFRAMVNENELTDGLTGNTGNMKLQTSLEFFMSKLEPKIQGFKRKFRNSGFVFIVIDRNGTKFAVGNLLNPAYMTQANGTTGRTGEDNTGTAFILTSDSPLLVYEGTIPRITPPAGGGGGV